MIGLLDCNNFYVSCERLFNPKLLEKPVVILSNNDGCVISRSEEAKQIGIKMGEPFFKLKKFIIDHNISVLSSNYSFYGDISNRIMNILKKSLPIVEVYSIDEAFFTLDLKNERAGFCNELAKKILKWTGVPVSIGLAKTKTLAKIANRVIKKKTEYPYLKIDDYSIFELGSKKLTDYVLQKTNVNDIWGIGNKLAQFLVDNGVNNALDLREFNESFARKKKGVILQRSILELKGIICNEVEKESAKKKSICVSRSFGTKLNAYEDIKSALIVYVQKASFKMRNYNFFCKSITVFLKTSKYQKKIYNNTKTYSFLEGTNDVRVIWNISKKLLKEIYLSDFLYSKVGVILSDFCDFENTQKSLFYDKNQGYYKKSDGIKLMKIMDSINKKFGDSKLRLSSDENGSFYLKKKNTKWLMKSEYRSPCYTTNWCDIPKIKV
mgnify:FL=1